MVTHRWKIALAAGAILACPAPALAQGSDLETRVQALEALVQELQQELAAARAEQVEADDAIVRLESAATEDRALRPSAQTANADGFMVGDTRVRIGGFMDLDAHVTTLSDGAIASGSIARDFYIPGATPVGGEETTTTDFTAESTRIFVNASRDVNGRAATGYLEVDFLGSLQGDERVSNSFSPRLRRAYLDYNGFRLGQDWSTFQNTSAIPESASFLILPDGMVFVRQAQIRYTNGPWQFALENGDTTFTSVGGGRVEADTNTIPDVVARYNRSGNFGNYSVALLLRQLRADIAGVDDEAFGYALSVGGRLAMGPRDDLRFNLTGGEGVGRYIGLNAANAAMVDPMTGDLEAVSSVGGLVAWRHAFGADSRFNIGVSGLSIDNPDFAPGSSTSEVISGYAAVLTDIAPNVSLGVELMHGMRETEAGADGSISRFTFSTRYGF